MNLPPHERSTLFDQSSSNLSGGSLGTASRQPLQLLLTLTRSHGHQRTNFLRATDQVVFTLTTNFLYKNEINGVQCLRNFPSI